MGRIGRAMVAPVVFASLVVAGVGILRGHLSSAYAIVSGHPQPWERHDADEVLWPLAWWAVSVVATVGASSVLSQRPLVRCGERTATQATVRLLAAVLVGLVATWSAPTIADALAVRYGCHGLGGGEVAILPLYGVVYLAIPCEAAYVVAVGRVLFVDAQPASERPGAV